jgi:hypothetical protein
MGRREMYKIMLVVWVFIAVQPLKAQNAIDDFKKVNVKMESRKFNMTMKYALFETYTSVKSVEEKTYRISCWQTELAMHVEGIDMIQSGGYSLYMDHDHKVAILEHLDQKVLKKQIAELSQWMTMDSIMSVYSRTELISDKNNQRIWRLHLDKNNRFAYTDVTINTKTFLLEKAQVYFSQSMDDLLGNRFSRSNAGKKPRLEIVFRDIEFPAGRNASAFTITQYVTVPKKGPKALVHEYKAYEFVDYTQKNKRRK